MGKYSDRNFVAWCARAGMTSLGFIDLLILGFSTCIVSLPHCEKHGLSSCFADFRLPQ